jgi:glycosyltransferase involved in cell wall biosynthesis
MHTRPGFSCDWFEHATPIVSRRDAAVKRDDIIVVPEIYGGNIRKLPPGIRQVIFNQNAYITLNMLAASPINATPYSNNSELAWILVVSQDNADLIQYTFPDAPVRRLRLGIDPAVYYPPISQKKRRIAYMPRKRPRDAKLVLELLRQRGLLVGWDVVPIDGRSEADTAEVLRSAKIFLSFSSMEGFGLPPLEALACGCFVVGYHGFGGREYFHPPFATAVEDGDILAFARAVEAAIHRIDGEPFADNSFATSASRFVFERYSLEAERRDVLDVFVPLLQRN